jgi:LysM repeat protein
MPRTRVRFGRVGALLAAVALVLGMAGRALGGSTEVPAPELRSAPASSYVVRPGDTLWEIARARVGPEADPRPMVEVLRVANGLGTAPLQAGASLVVPPAP